MGGGCRCGVVVVSVCFWYLCGVFLVRFLAFSCFGRGVFLALSWFGRDAVVVYLRRCFRGNLCCCGGPLSGGGGPFAVVVGPGLSWRLVAVPMCGSTLSYYRESPRMADLRN